MLNFIDKTYLVEYIGKIELHLLYDLHLHGVKLTRGRTYLNDKGICQLCLLPVAVKDFTRDHIRPRSKGGTNAHTNLQTAHKKCNGIKGNMLTQPPPEYFRNFASEKLARRREIKLLVRVLTLYEPLTEEEMKVDYCMELFNEIQRNGMKNLSYNTFREHFEKYASVKRNNIINNETDLSGTV